MKEPNCEGCTDAPWNCNKYNKDGSCPCTQCIVKTMCIDVCDKWNIWCVLKEKGEYNV